jgi:hypothetical protein
MMQGGGNDRKKPNEGDTDDVAHQKQDEERRKKKEAREMRLSLWKAGLEVFIHQLLWTRKVYPKSSFCSSRFLGSQFKISRHPGVVSYIKNALHVVVPALILEGNSKELLIEIYDQAKFLPYEQYTLTFSKSKSTTTSCDTTTTAAAAATKATPTSSSSATIPLLSSSSYCIEEMEKELRDLIFSVGRMAKRSPSCWPGSVSFKILLLVDFDGKRKSNTATELNEKWYRANDPTMDNNSDERRIIYDIPYCGCEFKSLLLREPIKRKRKVRIKLPKESPLKRSNITVETTKR